MSNPLRPTGNPLLDDALDDGYQLSLTSGNLKRKRPPPEAAPAIISHWVSLGYWAHVDTLTCTACGSVHSNLVGVFLREHALEKPSTVRSTALKLRAFRDLNLTPQLELIPASVDLCAECISAPLTSPQP